MAHHANDFGHASLTASVVFQGRFLRQVVPANFGHQPLENAVAVPRNESVAADLAQVGIAWGNARQCTARRPPSRRHQAGIEGQQIIRPQSPSFHRTRAEVFNQHIALGGQLAHDVLRGGLIEVQRQRLLVARLHLPPDQGAVFHRAPLAQRVARAGGLDLDHIGPKIARGWSGKRAGDQLVQFKNLEPGQGAGTVQRKALD